VCQPFTVLGYGEEERTLKCDRKGNIKDVYMRMKGMMVKMNKVINSIKTL
jgi:hypothetical protein